MKIAITGALSEGITEPLPRADTLPEDLAPKTLLTDLQIRRGLPQAEAFGFRDCR